MSVTRAYRVALNPNRDQLQVLSRHVGAARWAYNHALAIKVAAHRRWRQEVAWATYEHGVDEATARTMVTVRVPTKPAIQKALNAVKGDSRAGVDGACPWWHEVSTYAFQSAFVDADWAWDNWLVSLKGQRPGRRVRYPKFKKRGRTLDSVRIHHDVKRPTIRPDGYRRLIVPRIGSIPPARQRSPARPADRSRHRRPPVGHAH
ncbi:MAG: helix-turn-helix domain-containing protein, partial [Dermatophilaceae bacterium]